MKQEVFDATAESAYGKSIASYGKGVEEVSYSGSYQAFENYDEVKDANELPSNDEILKFVNGKRKASARQGALVTALKAVGIMPPDPNLPEVAAETMLKNIDKLDLPQDQKDMMVAVLKAKLDAIASKAKEAAATA